MKAATADVASGGNGSGSGSFAEGVESVEGLNLDIVMDNFSDSECTVMTLSTKNRAGLLFDIMAVLKSVDVR